MLIYLGRNFFQTYMLAQLTIVTLGKILLRCCVRTFLNIVGLQI